MRRVTLLTRWSKQSFDWHIFGIIRGLHWRSQREKVFSGSEATPVTQVVNNDRSNNTHNLAWGGRRLLSGEYSRSSHCSEDYRPAGCLVGQRRRASCWVSVNVRRGRRGTEPQHQKGSVCLGGTAESVERFITCWKYTVSDWSVWLWTLP